MTSEHQKQSGYNNGLISILKEFTRSVEKLNQAVLFPVRLQDMDINSVTHGNNEMAEVFKHCFGDKNEDKDPNLYELYMLLRATRTELITGSDDDGRKASQFQKDLRRIMDTVKQLTDLSEIVRMNYETSLLPPRNV